MGTIREKLAYLSNTKALIRNAIIDKGVAVSTSDTFRSYAEKIGLIQGGSGSGSSMNLGPYAEPTMDYTFSNKAGSLPTFSTERPVLPEYKWNEDWWNIEEILDADGEDYPAKMIVLYPAESSTISLTGANFYRVSDGTTYTANGTHTWDTSFDKVNSEGVGYRYVIYYYSSANGYSSSSVQSGALAIITKGFKWTNSAVFSNRRRLEYIKTKDSDWSSCTSTASWCYKCQDLIYASFDFNNGKSIKEPIENMQSMFEQCYHLAYIDFSFPAYANRFSYMFKECYDLNNVHLDFSYRDMGACTPSWSECWRSTGPSGNVILSLNPNQNMNTYRPWIGIKTDHPLKVSSVEWTNHYEGSSNYDANYTPSTIDIEASNDNVSWKVVGTIEISDSRVNKTTITELNLEDAYQYWRFRSAPISQFGCNFIKLNAQWEKTTLADDGTETKEWVDWTQPTFSSNVQDDCILSASSVYSDSSNYDVYKAFRNKGSSGSSNNWVSKTYSYYTDKSGWRCFSLYGAEYQANTTANIMYVEGTDSSTGFFAPGLRVRYVIFENTDNFTSMNGAFDNGYSGNGASVIGCIIPNVTKITDWNYAFRGCSSMTVAPQIEFNADATVYWMFKDTGITDFSFLDYSVLKNATGLLAGTKITQANIELPEATVLDALFEYCTSLVRANVVAPKARGCAYLCNNSARSINSSYRQYLENAATNSLKYIKVSGYNQEDRATLIDKWTRPNLSSNTSYGTVSVTGLSTYSSDSYPYLIYNGSTSSYRGSGGWYRESQYTFRGTGSITWVLPDGVEPTIKGLTFMSGNTVSSPSSTFKCRLYADADKTIPLTDEFTVNGSVYRDKHAFTLETPVKTGTIVIDITENSNYASIMDVSFDAEIESSGYMVNMDHAFHGSEVVHVDMDTSKVTNMSYMCAYAPNILDVSDFDFSSATNMDHAFYYNPSLTELNKVTFPKATNLNYAFANCWGLAEVTEFSAPECTTASYMFSQCTSLGAVLQPDMPKVTNLIRAFEQCDFLKDLDLSNIDSEVACDYICYQDHALAKVKLPSKPTNLQYAFQGCYALRQANLGNTSKVTSMLHAFEECRKLISVSSLDLSACTDMNYMFRNCYWLENIDITNLDSIVGTDLLNYAYDNVSYYYYRTYNWFENCRSLVSVTLPAMPKVQGLDSIFIGCSSLTDVTVGATPVCKSLANFCQNCSSLTSATFADTSKVERMNHMFEGCSSLEVQPEMSTTSTKTVEALFNGCNLKSVNLELPQVTRAQYLCCNNANLANVSITFGQKITNAARMFTNCKSLTDLSFADNWDMSNCDSLAYMFNGCEGLTSITLDKWTLKASSDLDRIVASNKNLVSFTLDFKGVSHSGNKPSMVADCPKLESFNMVNPGNLSNFYGLYYNTYFKTITLNIGDYCSSCPSMIQIFESCPNLESVILNFSGRYLDRMRGDSDSLDMNYNPIARMFAYSPKLKRIDILNADNIHNWNSVFQYMNNTEDCVVDWNNSRIPYSSIWRKSFDSRYNANLKHVNMLTSEDYPGYRAFNIAQTEGFVAEPMLQEAQVDLKLPVDIQINKLTFTQRAGNNNVSDANGNEYDFPTTARFYSDKECQTPISAAMTLEPTASSVAEVDVADVVTDSITCKFGRDLGRYMGVGQIGISAKAKGYESWSTWTRPNLSSNTSYGVVSCGSYYSDSYPYKAFDGTVTNTWYGWYANGTPSWLKWQLPKAIKIKGLRVVSCYYNNSSYYSFQGRFYTSDDKTIPMGDAFSFDSWNQTKTIANIPEEGIITDCIYLDKTGGGYYSGVQEIYIEADEQTYEWHPWSTPEETWIEQEEWKQPAPTANDSDGTFSASSEDTDHEAYRITTSDGWQATAEDTDAYVQWVLPNTVHSSEISFASDTVASCQLYSDEGTTALGDPLEQTVTATNFANNVFIYPNNKVVVPDTATKLECIFKVNFSSVTDSGTLLWAASDTGFFIYSTHLSFWKDARYEGDVALSANKWYWVKATWTESNVSTKILEDNGYAYNTLPEDSAWTSDLVTTNTNVSHMVNSVLWVGGRESTNGGADQYLRGIIDLTNSRILVDDEIWWDPTQANSYTINGDVTIDHSGFICYDKADISTLRIKPLTKFDDSAVASFKNLNIEATYDVQKSNVVDFVMPVLDAYSQDGYEVTCSQAQRCRYATNNSTYYSWYTYGYQGHPVIDFPPIIGCLAELYYMYLLESNIDTGVQPKAFKNLDFFATTINNPSWVSDNNWWQNNNSNYYQRVMPMSFQNPRNICASINLSQFSGLNHDSLIELLKALVSRKGISAATLTLGSQNLAKLTDEEKAIATEKNWNLA